MSNTTNALAQLQSDLVGSSGAIIHYQVGCGDDAGKHLDIQTIPNPRLAIVGDDGEIVELAGVDRIELISPVFPKEIWVDTGGGLVRFVRSD